MYTFQSLSSCSLQQVADAFNAAFADYQFPMQVTADDLGTRWKTWRIDPAISVGAFHEGELVGVIQHGLDTVDGKRTAWNGGTGVVPEHRGQHLTQRMYAAALPWLRAAGVKEVQLEVLADNVPAIKAYERTGFATTRGLNCFKGEVWAATDIDNIEYEGLNTSHFPQFEACWDFRPTWQNDFGSIQAGDAVFNSVIAREGDTIIGYALFEPDRSRLTQIAVHPAHRGRGIGKAVLIAAQKVCTDPFTIINVDAGSTHTSAFFDAVGMQLDSEQLDMAMPL